MENKRRLSRREREVLLLIAYEFTNSEIADRLNLKYATVATYRNNILYKLSANNTAGLVRIAFEYGVLVLNKNRKITLAHVAD